MEDSSEVSNEHSKLGKGRAVINASQQVEISTASNPPHPLTVGVWVTTPKGKQEKKPVLVRINNCWALLTAASRQCVLHLGDSPLAFCEEGSYERIGKDRPGRAIACFNDQFDICSYDFDDNKPVDPTHLLELYVRFLRPSSPLPYSLKRQSVIFIRTNTELLTVSAEGNIQFAPNDALTDPSFVVLMRGLASGKELLWEDDMQQFFSAVSGEFLSRQKISGEATTRRHIILLLREGIVPRFLDSRADFLLLFVRVGLLPCIKDNSLRCSKSSEGGDIEKWKGVFYHDPFYRDFFTAARAG